MTTQRQIIKRQVVELHISSTADAQQLQTEVSRIYRQRILPLIDRYCTELSAPDLIHRIDSLTVDLGMVDPQHLEEDLVAKVTSQLRTLLAEPIKAQGREADGSGVNLKTASQLELLSVFAQTGALPWWADSSHPHLLDDSLQYLIHNAPDPLRRLMRELAQEQSSLQRIVHHFEDRLLADLAAVLAPSLDLATFAHLVPDLVLVLRNMTSGASQRQTRLRHLAWGGIMQRVSLRGEQETAWSPVLHAVLIHVARELGVTYTALLSGIQQVVQQDHTRFQSPVGEITETLYTEFLHTQEASLPYVRETRPEPNRRRQSEGIPPWTSLLPLLRALATRLPEPSQAPMLAALDRLERGTRDKEAVTELLQVLRFALEHQHLPPTLVQRWQAELEQLAVGGFSQRRVQALTEILQDVFQQIASYRAREDRPEPARRRQRAKSSGALKTINAPLDLIFSDADEWYIDNAGLVILHPFLRHFFERLGLLEEKQFPDMASRQRAVGLLQYAVSEDPSPPEYLLPLNKVLCGMELDDVFDFGPLVTETEAEECTNLLSAVIANAPILKNMSINGLRGTFLLRPGVLSSRDGAWLLRVERETYDVVLDRFPWTLQWVKLTWMDTPLRVEW